MAPRIETLFQHFAKAQMKFAKYLWKYGIFIQWSLGAKQALVSCPRTCQQQTIGSGFQTTNPLQGNLQQSNETKFEIFDHTSRCLPQHCSSLKEHCTDSKAHQNSFSYTKTSGVQGEVYYEHFPIC